MRLKGKISSSLKILNFILLEKRSPVAARINLNNRCAYRCTYCNVWNTPTKEMTTKEVFSLIDQLKKLGTERISISGGEPMLRKDIGKIISYCKKQKISTDMNTTGFAFDRRIGEIRDLDLIKFSLDGNEESHDPVRGKGTFRKTMNSIEIACKNKMKFSFAATLTRKSTNVENIDFLLQLSKRYNTFTAFQPLKEMHKGVKDISHLAPEKEQYKEAIHFLIAKKKEKAWAKHIRNSLQGLLHIEDWPRYKQLKCHAGDIFIIIQPNGDIIPCDRIKDTYKEPIPNFLDQGLENSFNSLPKVHCSGCGFCGALELNFISNKVIDVIPEIRRVVSR